MRLLVLWRVYRLGTYSEVGMSESAGDENVCTESAVSVTVYKCWTIPP